MQLPLVNQEVAIKLVPIPMATGTWGIKVYILTHPPEVGVLGDTKQAGGGRFSRDSSYPSSLVLCSFGDCARAGRECWWDIVGDES